MITDITLGQYLPGTSFIHQLDPRTKILSTVLFIGSVFLAEKSVSYGIITLFLLFIVLLSQVPLRFIVRSLRPLWIIIVLTFGVHIFTTPGNVLYSVGPVIITEEGVHQGLLMTSRLVYLIIVSSLLTYTTSPLALTDGIEKILNPFKAIGVPAHELAMMMTIALRFIPTLLEETDRIMKAQIARGAEFSSGNILKRAKSLVPLLVPLFISAFRRADELATAMESRCYRGGQNRTRMKELALGPKDVIAFIFIAGLIAILVALRFWQ